MRHRFLHVQSLAFTTAVIFSLIGIGQACTGIWIKPKDGAVIHARTLEFTIPLKSNVIVVPRGMDYVGTAPDDNEGIHWRAKYACVGASLYEFFPGHIADGVNEKGLAVGLFQFSSYAKYPEVSGKQVAKALSTGELCTYLLTRFASVAEVKQGLSSVIVANVAIQNFESLPTKYHYIVQDAAGECIVLEPVSSGLKVFENPLGAITNSPTFDWQLINLGNYVNLGVTEPSPVAMAGIEIKPFGQGSGMLGLPGGFTSPSRFIRAVLFSQAAPPVETAQDGVLQAFHFLNQFDVPKGASRPAKLAKDGENGMDYTLWTSASDLKNKRFYFHTYQDRRIHMADLMRMDLNAKQIKTISMSDKEEILNVTNQAK